MQRYNILHRTYYNFTAAVRLEPHTLRLRPREGHELRIEASNLDITPPATLRWHRDVEDNSVAIATFKSPSTQLLITSMEAARCLGFATRFVSGYLHTPPSDSNFGATHAWAEVFLPGVGWKGFDPTIGTIVGTDHIAVAVARLPESVPPVAGAFTGMASATLNVGVWVTAC